MRKLTIGLIAFAVFSFGSARAGAEGRKDSRYLIYVHGRIVQVEQSERPQHPRYGFYELDKILDTFRERGFVVTGEIRPKEADMSDSADKVVAQVHKLLESGVPPDHITVVGGSMGGSIALMAATRLQNPDVRFATLGVCLSRTARALLFGEGKAPAGRILPIRESSDETTEDCPKWEDDPELAPKIVAREILLNTGLSHGFLYRPMSEWIDPVVEWAKAGSDKPATP